MTQLRPLTVAKLRAIQRDVRSPSAARLPRLIFERLRGWGLWAETARDHGDQLRALEAWQGDYHAQGRGPMAFQTLVYYLADGCYRPRRGRAYVTYLLATELAVESVLHLVQTQPRPVLAPILQRAFDRARRSFRRFRNWGDMHRITVGHLLAMAPVLGGKYRLARWPAPGSSQTLLKRAHGVTPERHLTTYGANARQISVLRKPDENWFVLFGGQDGWLGSTTFADQVRLFREGRYIRVPLTLAAVRRTFRRVMRLKPSPRPVREPRR